MTQRFDWETLFIPQSRIRQWRFRRYRKSFDQTFAIEACRLSFVLDVTEHRKQTFFPIDHVFRSENPSRASNALSAPWRPAQDRPCSSCLVNLPAVTAPGQTPRGADPDRHTIWIGREIGARVRRYRRRERAQRCVMPAVFTNSAATISQSRISIS